MKIVRKSLWLIALVCVSVPVIYVLTTGPVVLACEKFLPNDHPIVNAAAEIYSPLLWYVNNNREELPAQAVAAYLALWGWKPLEIGTACSFG